MGDRRICNGEYKCELSGTNKQLVPDHIDHLVESGSFSATQNYNDKKFNRLSPVYERS